MTAAAVIQLVAGMLFGLGIWSIAAERRMVRRMRLFGATRPDSAVPLGARTPVARYRLWRLTRAGAVVEAKAGTHYLDARAYEKYREARRTRAIVIMALALAALTIARRTWR